MATLLQVPPSQGGMRFGPFPGGIIQIGSAQGHCQVVVPAASPVHAMLTDMGDGTYTLAPAQAGLGLFLIQGGQGQAWPVQGPVQASIGDTIVIGDPTGLHLNIQKMSAAPSASPGQSYAGAAPGAAGGGIASSQFAKGMQNEVLRQIRSRIGTTSWGRFISQNTLRLRGGTFFQPRYVIGAVVAVGGFLVLGCGGILAAVGAWFGLS